MNRNGWLPDRPDNRDLSGVVLRAKRKGGKASSIADESLPGCVDLSSFDTPVRDQRSIGSCTAHAVCALYESLQRRTRGGDYTVGSTRFLYKVTRNLLGWKGDQGAHLRTTLKALRLFGVPPEIHWKYSTKNYDIEPTAYVYSLAQSFQALQYRRVDVHGISGSDLLAAVRRNLSQGHPMAFGFTTFQSLQNDSVVPFPSPSEKADGGHAVLAVGYDDSKGCVRFKNSWGATYGDAGYGWLPYQYITAGLTADWWMLLDAETVDLSVFE